MGYIKIDGRPNLACGPKFNNSYSILHKIQQVPAQEICILQLRSKVSLISLIKNSTWLEAGEIGTSTKWPYLQQPCETGCQRTSVSGKDGEFLLSGCSEKAQYCVRFKTYFIQSEITRGTREIFVLLIDWPENYS